MNTAISSENSASPSENNDAPSPAPTAVAGDPSELRAPMTVAAPGLPTRVTIWEVGPRDGLQNEATVLPVEVKVEFIERLVDAGLPIVEATSFVRPDRVVQLADAEALMMRLERRPGVRYPVLVPNDRGLNRALELGLTDIAVFASATETFAQANLGRSLDDSMAIFAPVVARAVNHGVRVRGYISMCFGDPWEGDVPIEAPVRVAARLMEFGCEALSIGDTIGVATAGHVVALLDALSGAGIDAGRIAVHFHDTYGQALANTLAALQWGVTTVDSSAGGLGGCPFAKSATGNLATEDLVWMLNGLGVATGVDLGRLVAASVWMAGHLGRESPSRAVRALAGSPA